MSGEKLDNETELYAVRTATVKETNKKTLLPTNSISKVIEVGYSNGRIGSCSTRKKETLQTSDNKNLCKSCLDDIFCQNAEPMVKGEPRSQRKSSGRWFHVIKTLVSLFNLQSPRCICYDFSILALSASSSEFLGCP